MMKLSLRCLRLALIAACVLHVFSARAQDMAQNQTERVVAVVNNEGITAYDLDQRVRIALTSGGITPDPQIVAEVTPQVLRRLVDEHLQLQEAKHLKIDVSNAEVTDRITQLAARNHLSLDEFQGALKSRGINIEALRQQTRAELAWTAVVRSEVLPLIQIGEDEITGRLQEYRANLGKPEYLASDIFLAVEDTTKDREIRELAQHLSDQLKQGTPFASLAQQFSQTGAATGGDLGWVSHDMVDDSVLAQLAQMQPNDVSAPIRASDGYHIVLLRDKRIAGATTSAEPTFDVAFLEVTTLPSTSPAEAEAQVASARKTVEGAKSCDDFESRARNVPNGKFTRAGKLLRSQLPPELIQPISALQNNQMTQTFDDGLSHRVFFLCERNDPRNGLPTREEVRIQLQNERANLAARRYIRDLRRTAFVQFRI